MERYAWLKEVLWVCAMLCLRLRAVLWVVLWGRAMAAVPLSIESSIERGAWAGAWCASRYAPFYRAHVPRTYFSGQCTSRPRTHNTQIKSVTSPMNAPWIPTHMGVHLHPSLLCVVLRLCAMHLTSCHVMRGNRGLEVVAL